MIIIVVWLVLLTAAVLAMAIGLCRIGAAAERESECLCRREGER